MKKFFVFVLTATMVVACQSRKEPVATMELQEEGISGDTLVSVYEGWAESQDGSSVLYDLMILTPENGGDVSYEMMMTYYDPVTKQDSHAGYVGGRRRDDEPTTRLGDPVFR